MLHAVHTNKRSVLDESVIPKNLEWSEVYVKIYTADSYSNETFPVLTAEDKAGVYYKPTKPHRNRQFESFFYFQYKCSDFNKDRVVLIRSLR